MADIRFDEEQPVSIATQQQVPALARLVMRLGFAKDQKGAEKVLLLTIALCVLVIVGILVFGRQSTPPPQNPLNPDWPRPVTR